MTLGIANGTALDVSIFVNGSLLHTYKAGQGDLLSADRLPALPWQVEAKTSTGRDLLSLQVHEGDLWREPCANNSLDAVLDLSCGRLQLWSVVPGVGPAPGPGTPGDCNP
jgi:hypothetical protein